MVDPDIDAFDSYIRMAIHAYAGPGVTALMSWITVLGSSVVLYTASALIAAGLWKRGYRGETRILAITMVGASILNMTLKPFFHRPRPEPFFDLAIPNSFSFPSGHALVSLCFFAGIAGLIANHSQSRNMRIAVWSVAVGIAMLIGISRIYLGVHYPSDVVGGYTAGSAWLAVVAIIRRRFW